MSDLTALSKAAADLCKRKGWSRDWSNGGCYLHLEVSEFIEALRGKGSSTPEEEAGDVIFVLASICGARGMDLDAIVQALWLKMEKTE